MAERKFEFSDNKSHKFWNIEHSGKKVETSYGRIGGKSQATVKEFADDAKAKAHFEKLIEQKTSKGYVEVGGSTASSSSGGSMDSGGRRVFHFVSGSSSKFWAIEKKGCGLEVTYGKIGTNGQTKSKEFPTQEKADAAYEKLVSEKVSKGYVEAAGGGSEDSAGTLSPMMFATTKSTDDIGELKTFVGKRVARYKIPKDFKKDGKSAYEIYTDWDDEGEFEFMDMINSFFLCEGVEAIEAFVLGNWSCDGPEPADPIVEKMLKEKGKLQNLVALFFGDIGQEENEISWIENCELGPLINALPNLELFRVRGATGLGLSKLKHDKLRALAVESGGLDRKVVKQLSQAKLPNLEYLELWLGTSDYGGNCTVNDLQPILKGKLFPKLKYLGLRNSEIADEIAGVAASSPILQQLETLDLSLGTMTDEGAQALSALPSEISLKRLDVHHNYLSKTGVKKIKALPLTVNVRDQQSEDEWGRFVAIGE